MIARVLCFLFTHFFQFDMALCRYEVFVPVAWVATPPSSFVGLETLGTGSPNVTVVGGGSLRLDYGRERAGWFEFTSPDLGSQVNSNNRTRTFHVEISHAARYVPGG